MEWLRLGLCRVVAWDATFIYPLFRVIYINTPIIYKGLLYITGYLWYTYIGEDNYHLENITTI